jgi:hypothetical protein
MDLPSALTWPVALTLSLTALPTVNESKFLSRTNLSTGNPAAQTANSVLRSRPRGRRVVFGENDVTSDVMSPDGRVTNISRGWPLTVTEYLLPHERAQDI